MDCIVSRAQGIFSGCSWPAWSRNWAIDPDLIPAQLAGGPNVDVCHLFLRLQLVVEKSEVNGVLNRSTIRAGDLSRDLSPYFFGSTSAS